MLSIKQAQSRRVLSGGTIKMYKEGILEKKIFGIDPLVLVVSISGVLFFTMFILLGIEAHNKDNIFLELHESKTDITNKHCVDRLLEVNIINTNKIQAIKTCSSWGYD